jgi:hypothetical protein
MRRHTWTIYEPEMNQQLKAQIASFQGIRLRCMGGCRRRALAPTSAIAEKYGWSRLFQQEESNYAGLCLECGSRVAGSRKRR